ncbi:MAG: hypothetical protein U9R44_07820 [Candidatus Omnitrophota bacterium]|nr:hypothetical protein [Candidatus Omnitrophota bacterium]
MFAKLLKTLIGIFAIPVAIGTGRAFYLLISGISVFSGTLHVLERGLLAYLLFHVLIMRPAYIYVLGHETMHVIATWLCGGKVISFNVTPSGGNVVTSKTNFFIELSPYFVPIYTVLLGPVYFALRAMDKQFPHMSLVFIFLIGVTLAFHFVMTSEVIRLRQPDIVKSGLLFSLVLIFVGNLVIVMAVFCPLFDLSFTGFIKKAALNSAEIYRLVYGNVLEFVNTNKIW